MEAEYGANIIVDKLPFSHARWVVAQKFDPRAFDWEGNRQTVQDRDGLPLVLFRDEWAMHHALCRSLACRCRGSPLPSPSG